MLTLTSPIETPLHRLPAGLKLAMLALATGMLFRLTGPVALCLALGGVVLIHALCGRDFARHGARMLRPLWPFLLIVGLWHFWLGDLRAGAVILLRLVTAVALANLVTMTTRLADMIGVIEALAQPLRRIGLSPRSIALSMALVVRFLPILALRLGQIREAWSARAPRRPGWRVLVPAALAALDDAERVAEALRARGGVD